MEPWRQVKYRLQFNLNSVEFNSDVMAGVITRSLHSFLFLICLFDSVSVGTSEKGETSFVASTKFWEYLHEV